MPEDTINPEPQDGTNETPDTQPVEGATETFDRAYVEKLRREAATYRTRAKELEEQRQTEEAKRLEQAPLEERLKALEAEREELTKRAAAESERATAAERLASLTGKVADPKAALKLLEDKHLKDDKIDVDRLLKDYPFLAPTGVTPTRGAGGTPRSGQLTPEDFRGKTQAWIEANLHRLTPTKE